VLRDVSVGYERQEARPPFVLRDVRDVYLGHVRAQRPDGVPFCVLRDVRRLLLRDSPDLGGPFPGARESRTRFRWDEPGAPARPLAPPPEQPALPPTPRTKQDTMTHGSLLPRGVACSLRRSHSCSARSRRPSPDAPAPGHRLEHAAPPAAAGLSRPYGPPSVERVTEVLHRVLAYLDAATPARIVSSRTGQEITDTSRLGDDAIIERGDFRLISYEWGVTYSGMLLAGEATGDPGFTEYAARRLQLNRGPRAHYRARLQAEPQLRTPLGSVLDPRALDDAGSMCAAMIKALRAGIRRSCGPSSTTTSPTSAPRSSAWPTGRSARKPSATEHDLAGTTST